MFIKILICLVLGYCFGCISTGYIVGKANKIDIRKYGSGNAGTTNALRTLGWKAGLLTFLGDAIKAILPILLIRLVIFPDYEALNLLMLYTGLGAVLGHNFPFWLHFKGGKGIAATGGVMLAYDWRLAVAALVVFLIIVVVTRYVSLGSLVISTLLPIWIIIFYPGNLHMIIVGIIFTLSAFIKHRSNIKRLMSGTENKIGQKVKIDK
ncbi:glycerol-3-phosphate 1-O-acyltransferase PlsY [Anaerocolumna aminovalerica]|jgi:glycerol-3-phosphate acyltransferase PlsY|uniref:Glycerol-3-phosphate acyltransferase n=1 Tax=Anaerocolumna aminovalerica TaxID=1527 RepID=A0A1I5CKV8_9FIRM|nr:glycerol-3-phosphate 1-O-acyltransferase PlsY [Anaerocolumna aminovalerica]MBU5334209.1 glycerol-3-phosphate 1-O-acyltransferase PlsY [Anaerocolumna aminovalerica]MDU6265666.1 glycerol-3-phosphate 1-O-acyltransferase PlsY [Anaerocolumna aminovalerica]SFN87639.1 glycerol-3-phosphate acyltransferase PlsY [Anaerocolumna aminovalerica]